MDKIKLIYKTNKNMLLNQNEKNNYVFKTEIKQNISLEIQHFDKSEFFENFNHLTMLSFRLHKF